jgi:peptide/nickel transport system substrate-binding protein
MNREQPRWVGVAIVLTLLLALATLAACGGTPEVETVIEQVEVVVTRIVEGETVTVIETQEVEVEREVVVTPTAEPGRSTFIVALASAPTSLDPADHRDRNSETVIRNMFDGLVTRDTTSGVHLELAEEMNWVDDVTLDVKIREGVTFHNGEELTADDVVFTFERIINENAIEYPEAHTSPRKGLIAPLASIEKVDDYTVRMNFNGVWPPAMQLLVHQQILPKDYLEEVGTEGFIAHPIGSGPFMFVEGQLDDQIVMERFADYWGGAPDLEPVGPACVERVIFRIIPEASTRAAALLAGEVDVIQNVPSELIDTLDQTPGIDSPKRAGHRADLDPAKRERPPLRGRYRAPGAQLRHRQRAAYRGDLRGRAVPLPGPLSPYNNFVNEDLEPYPYDPELAASMLEEAGWSDTTAMAS